jgi:hypothetical protein
MRPSFLRVLIYTIALWVGRFTVVATLAFALVQFAPDVPTTWPETVAKSQQYAKDHYRAGFVVLSSMLAGAMALRKWIGEPRFWRAVHDILTVLQSEIFDDLDNAAQDDHRVTLYRYKRFCVWPNRCVNCYRFLWPYGHWLGPFAGWMVPAVRSGRATRGRTIFLARPGKYEGVCSAAWFAQNGQLEIENLADLSDNPTDEAIQAYAVGTFVTIKWLKQRLKKARPCARSFRTLRLRIRGEDWGMLMIDSRSPTLPKPNMSMAKMRLVHKILEALLKGV